MPIGALTLDEKKFGGGPLDAMFYDTITFTGDTSYPTGGSTGLQTALRTLTKDAREILFVVPIGACGGYVPRWDAANGKLMLYKGNGTNVLQEEANATNVGGVTFKLGVFSR